MRRSVSTVVVAAVFAALATPPAGAAQQRGAAMAGPDLSAPIRTGRVEANGVSYYYAIYGEGEPLLLLHGGLGPIEMFDPMLPALAEERQMTGVDLHGHGRTALGDRPISLVDMGDDMAVIAKPARDPPRSHALRDLDGPGARADRPPVPERREPDADLDRGAGGAGMRRLVRRPGPPITSSPSFAFRSR